LIFSAPVSRAISKAAATIWSSVILAFGGIFSSLYITHDI
jgi:hypothetical protein